MKKEDWMLQALFAAAFAAFVIACGPTTVRAEAPAPVVPPEFTSSGSSDFDAWRAAPLEAWKDEARALWPETAPLLDHLRSHDDLVFAVSTGTPDFGVSVSPASVSVVQGGSGSTTTTVTSLNGFSSAVSLSASGLPSGVTASFVTNPVTSDRKSVV